jgi:hypothetical protein
MQAVTNTNLAPNTTYYVGAGLGTAVNGEGARTVMEKEEEGIERRAETACPNWWGTAASPQEAALLAVTAFR